MHGLSGWLHVLDRLDSTNPVCTRHLHWHHWRHRVRAVRWRHVPAKRKHAQLPRVRAWLLLPNGCKCGSAVSCGHPLKLNKPDGGDGVHSLPCRQLLWRWGDYTCIVSSGEPFSFHKKRVVHALRSGLVSRQHWRDGMHHV